MQSTESCFCRFEYEIPESLIESFQKNEVVLFVGSGASIDASLPSWAALLESLARTIPNVTPETLGYVDQHLRQGHFLDVADYVRKILFPADMFSVLEKLLGRSGFAPGRIHRAVLSLPAAGIITTNYDRLLEIGDETRRFGVPFTWTDQALARKVGKRFLFKAHGSLDEPDSIILAGIDYERLNSDQNRQYKSFLSTYFSPPYRCVFVGYGFQDPDLNLLLRHVQFAWQSWHNPPIALLPVSNPHNPDPITDTLLRDRLRIMPLYISAAGDPGRAVSEWLQAVAARVQPIALDDRFILLPATRKTLVTFLEKNFRYISEAGVALTSDDLRNVEGIVNRLERSGANAVVDFIRTLLRRWPTDSQLRNIMVSLPPTNQNPSREQ